MVCCGIRLVNMPNTPEHWVARTFDKELATTLLPKISKAFANGSPELRISVPALNVTSNSFEAASLINSAHLSSAKNN